MAKQLQYTDVPKRVLDQEEKPAPMPQPLKEWRVFPDGRVRLVPVKP